jgi:hypothetical protein
VLYKNSIFFIDIANKTFIIMQNAKRLKLSIYT